MATTSHSNGPLEKVALVGSGNWGSAVAKIVGNNVKSLPGFDKEVRMWVYEEMVEGRNLTEIINTQHENVKYLPGIALPDNVVAIPDANEAVKDATILVFVLPHQFIRRVCGGMKGSLKQGVRAVSLIKGMDVDENGVVLISGLIRDALGVDDISVLMGANIADEVAKETFSEATLGYNKKYSASGVILQKVFNTSYFAVVAVPDVAGVELCGALKNIVALGAGFCDGLGYGGNTKAAIMRIGLIEMKRFASKFFEDVENGTFFESCGVADLIVTCYSGRNRKVAAAFAETGKDFATLEKEMLGGQLLQGTLTAQEVYQVLSKRNCTHEFPLFTTIYRIAFEKLPAKEITNFMCAGKKHSEL